MSLIRVPRALIAVFLSASLPVITSCASPSAAAPPPQPPEVAVIDVTERSLPISSEWVATLNGYVDAQVRPQVPGYLVRRAYQEGGIVHKGDVLFEIDPRPFVAALDQASAQLAQAEAQLGRTIQDYKRDTPLAAEHAIAQGQLDTEIAAAHAALATAQAAKAAVETAQLNLDFTRVTSLVDGIAGIATAQIGDLVGPTTLLTTVSQIEPIKAYFSVSEIEYLRMSDRINRPNGNAQPWDARTGLSLILSDGREYPSKGRFLAADREVDPKTGTIRLAAAFANPAHLLRPGQYARVHAVTATEQHAIVLPVRAISELQGRFLVRVVSADNRVSVRPVTVGDRVGSVWIIKSGLKPGERVAADGAQFLRDGTLVRTKAFTAATVSE